MIIITKKIVIMFTIIFLLAGVLIISTLFYIGVSIATHQDTSLRSDIINCPFDSLEERLDILKKNSLIFDYESGNSTKNSSGTNLIANNKIQIILGDSLKTDNDLDSLYQIKRDSFINVLNKNQTMKGYSVFMKTKLDLMIQYSFRSYKLDSNKTRLTWSFSEINTKDSVINVMSTNKNLYKNQFHEINSLYDSMIKHLDYK